MDDSISQVISSIVSLLHRTFTIRITLLPNCFISWSKIETGCISNDRALTSSIGGVSRVWDGSGTYIFIYLILVFIHNSLYESTPSLLHDYFPQLNPFNNQNHHFKYILYFIKYSRTHLLFVNDLSKYF